MHFIKDIIQRCHQRHKQTFRQQKTISTPSILRTQHTHQYTTYCARNYPVRLDDLETGQISFMPIGLAPENDSGAQGRAVGSGRFTRRFGIEDWTARRWEESWGVMIYTGIPSERDGALWHDIDFKYEAICAAPDTVIACLEALINEVANPLLTLTKSGGLRFSCRVQDYLHPGTQEERLYIYKHTPTADNPCHRDIYLEIFGDKGYSRWDARYEILIGNLLDAPLIPKEVLFAPLDTLRAELHEPAPDEIIQVYVTNTPLSLGSENLNLAKEDLLKRGFTYLRQVDGLHYWTRPGGDVNNTDVVLWEHDNTVWIRTPTPHAGLPLEATPITEVWSDTKIVPPMPIPVISDKMLSVRDGTLSPLAVKRPNPVLRKTEAPKNSEKTTILDGKARIVAVTAADGEHTELVDRTEESICIVRDVQAHDLFLTCRLPKTVLTEWTVNWQGQALENFSNALLNALEIRGEPHSAVVKRLRTVIDAFEPQEAEIIKQMPPVNIESQALPTVYSDPNLTFWQQLKRFFAHYTRNADAPIRLDNSTLIFKLPPVLRSSVRQLVVMSPTLSERHLRRAFPHDTVEVKRIKPTPWLLGNQVFQIRTGLYPREIILDYGNAWNVVGVSKIGLHFFAGIRTEIESEPSVQHVIISDWLILQKLKKIIKTKNVCFVTYSGKNIGGKTDSERAEVIWIVGTPERQTIGTIWERSQTLFGNDDQPLSYDRDLNTYHYKDERLQSVYQEESVKVITQMFGLAQLNHQTGKKVVLLTGLEIPGITDRPETRLFDWEDFEVAGGLDKLPEVIETRQRFEAERDNLTAESSRKEVERVLGCSSRQANRFLQKLRGGNLQRVPFREQILSLLADREKTTAELIEDIEGNPEAVKHELTRLVNADKIVRIRHGVYRSQ